MNGSASECSSGCESGWTMYLETSLSGNRCKRDGVFCEDCEGKRANVESEEEDSSMVSDASSGPPHFHEDEDCCDENGCFCSSSSAAALAKKSGKRRKMEQQEHPSFSFLDDTATSPVLGFSKKNFSLNKNQASMEHVLDFSQGFSATHFKGKSAFQKNFGFLESSLPGKPVSAEPVVCREEWE